MNLLETVEQVKSDTSGIVASRYKKELRWAIQKGEHADFVTISPAMAAEMLERNTDDDYRNRPVNAGTVRRYAKAMTEKRWSVTGEPIIFSADGVLLNGQHRLQACMASGMAFKTLVVYGIDRESFKFMDRGLRRTAAHIFAIEGVPNASLMAAVVNWIDRIQNFDGHAPNPQQKPENEQLLDMYYGLDRLQDSAWVSHKINTEGESLASNAMMTTLHYLFARKCRADADDFMEKVITGVGLAANSPERVLRKWLQNDNSQVGRRTSDQYRAAYTVLAWNARRTGKTIKLLRWRTEQSPNMPFPTIR